MWPRSQPLECEGREETAGKIKALFSARWRARERRSHVRIFVQPHVSSSLFSSLHQLSLSLSLFLPLICVSFSLFYICSHCLSLCISLPPSFSVNIYILLLQRERILGGHREVRMEHNRGLSWSPGSWPLSEMNPLSFPPLSIHSKMNKTSLSLSPATSVVSISLFLSTSWLLYVTGQLPSRDTGPKSGKYRLTMWWKEEIWDLGLSPVCLVATGVPVSLPDH